MIATRPLLVFLVLYCLASASIAASQLAPNRWTGIPRIVAFGDVHGAYEQLLIGLKAAAVIDDQLDWIGADTHLVSLGDLLDRGAESRKVMDLLMRLQSQAPASGGHVHVVIGNHEIMNLTGDLRYVAADEFAAFAADESHSKREAAFTAYLQTTETDPVAARGEFDSRFPAGYFGHREQFAATGQYGAWMLDQPLMVVLNETVFVHGGLPPVAGRIPLEEINETYTSDVTELMELGARLEQAGWVNSEKDLLLQDNAVLNHVQSADVTADPDLLAAARRFVALARGELFGIASPNWYRGTALCHRTLEQPVLTAALENLKAQRVVVGHTPTSNLRVQQRFEGRALLADTGMLRSYYGGQPAPVVFADDKLEILYPLQETSSDTPDYLHPLQFHGLHPDTLEALLTDGTISATTAATSPVGSTRVTIERGDKSLNAYFEPGSRQQSELKVAAYRLSRMLELNLVPVTVARSVDGRTGVLTALPAEFMSETTRIAAQHGRSNWCGVGNDYQLMYAFDALILNEQRTTESMIYDQQNWQLYLTGHGASFGSGTGTPRYLANIKKVMPGSLAADLARLDETRLQAELSELLSKRQIRALLKRRDRLIKTWTETEQ